MKWDSDGSFLNSWADPNHGIDAMNGDACLRYASDEMDDKDCSAVFNYICEFKCTMTTTVTNTTCQPTSGYTYKTSVDKYYKPVKDKVTWQTAKDACSSDGSVLVELRTSAEYQAIRPVYGMSFNRYDFYQLTSHFL